MSNKEEEELKRYSLRLKASLATRIEDLADSDNRSFNNQIIELIIKGLELREAEINHLSNLNPLKIVKDSKADGDDSLKHRNALAHNNYTNKTKQLG